MKCTEYNCLYHGKERPSSCGCWMSDAEQLRVANAALVEALEECEEYFDDCADADQPPGHPRPIPNREMQMLMEVRETLAKHGGGDGKERPSSCGCWMSDAEQLRVANAALVEALKPLLYAAEGLSHGTDWNAGIHAKLHGYRQKLLDAIQPARETLAKHGGGS